MEITRREGVRPAKWEIDSIQNIDGSESQNECIDCRAFTLGQFQWALQLVNTKTLKQIAHSQRGTLPGGYTLIFTAGIDIGINEDECSPQNASMSTAVNEIQKRHSNKQQTSLDDTNGIQDTAYSVRTTTNRHSRVLSFTDINHNKMWMLTKNMATDTLPKVTKTAKTITWHRLQCTHLLIDTFSTSTASSSSDCQFTFI